MAYGLFVAATIPSATGGALHLGGRTIDGIGYGAWVATAAWTLFALAVGVALRAQTERLAEMGRARAEADRARAEQSRRRASDERLRIARELHDVLGHHLSLINVRAGVALHLLDTAPEQTRDALSAIKQASSEALREVRGVLATLAPEDEAAPRAPAPGLAATADLVAEARAAGTPIAVERTGTVRMLPAEVQRAAYRIVREALTNVRRHAGPAAAVTLTLAYGPEGLTVRVRDDGPSTLDMAVVEGNGIAGMVERATALGGWLRASPEANGFLVEAYLPVAESPVGGAS
jgi:signal transduction histidine kinase